MSSWLVYAPGVSEHIEAASKQQDSDASTRAEPAPASAASLRTDFELARQEIRHLRRDRDDLRRQLRGSLDHQLTELSTAPLIERITALSAELTREHAANRELAAQVATSKATSTAPRRALRQMIRTPLPNLALPHDPACPRSPLRRPLA